MSEGTCDLGNHMWTEGHLILRLCHSTGPQQYTYHLVNLSVTQSTQIWETVNAEGFQTHCATLNFVCMCACVI